MAPVPTINADFPPKLRPLFQPKRYKVLHGGRGGAKSWGIARALLLLMIQRPLRVLCVRELQNSIKDSVHRLLSDQIELLGLQTFFDIQRDTIRCTLTGGEFLFKGIKHNVQEIKSTEGIDICWAEEAQLMSETSWGVLVPTIRKTSTTLYGEAAGPQPSEIWVSFNPVLETDATYKRFIENPPDDAWVQEINWRDNPWFTEAMRSEMEYMKRTNYDEYLHVWEGKCRRNLEGAVYVKELRAAEEDGRLRLRKDGGVPYDPSVGVHVFFDLGRADATAMWFAQVVAQQFRILRYFEDSGEDIDYYLKTLQRFEYVYDRLWLPHDAKAKRLGSKMSIEELVRAKGFKVRIVPKLSVTDGINAARTIFSRCWFDVQHCDEGLNALRHYRYEVIPGTSTFSDSPVHDEYSHGADAFRYMAIALKAPKGEREVDEGMLTGKQRAKNLMSLAMGARSTNWMLR